MSMLKVACAQSVDCLEPIYLITGYRDPRINASGLDVVEQKSRFVDVAVCLLWLLRCAFTEIK